MQKKSEMAVEKKDDFVVNFIYLQCVFFPLEYFVVFNVTVGNPIYH